MENKEIQELKAELKALSDKIAALEKGEERPMNWSEFVIKFDDYIDHSLPKKYAQRLMIFGHLLSIRDQWNRIDGWKRNGNDYSIIRDNDRLVLRDCIHHLVTFGFKDKATAQLFLETFRPQLEEIKEFL